MILGYIIGRFNPIHIGHMHIIEEMMSKSDIPVILIGSSNISMTKENPFSFEERKEILQKIYPSLIILPIPDFGKLKTWVSKVDKLIASVSSSFENVNDIILYTSKKDNDADLRVNWCSMIGHNVQGISERSDGLSATVIREIYFSKKPITEIKKYVHHITFEFLKKYKNTDEYNEALKLY
jgi:cytidyltransferase-like protein